MTTALENARAVLAELSALHREGWCACRSSTLPARIEVALGELIAAVSTPPETKSDEPWRDHLDITDRLIAMGITPRATVAESQVSADDAWDSYRFSNWINPQREPYTEGIFRAGFAAARRSRS